jgi:hypothetical protein
MRKNPKSETNTGVMSNTDPIAIKTVTTNLRRLGNRHLTGHFRAPTAIRMSW